MHFRSPYHYGLTAYRNPLGKEMVETSYLCASFLHYYHTFLQIHFNRGGHLQKTVPAKLYLLGRIDMKGSDHASGTGINIPISQIRHKKCWLALKTEY